MRRSSKVCRQVVDTPNAFSADAWTGSPGSGHVGRAVRLQAAWHFEREERLDRLLGDLGDDIGEDLGLRPARLSTYVDMGDAAALLSNLPVRSMAQAALAQQTRQYRQLLDADVPLSLSLIERKVFEAVADGTVKRKIAARVGYSDRMVDAAFASIATKARRLRLYTLDHAIKRVRKLRRLREVVDRVIEERGSYLTYLL